MILPNFISYSKPEIQKTEIIDTYYVEQHGKKFGTNNIHCIEADGVRICHSDYLGETRSDRHLAQIEKVDILLLGIIGGPMLPLNVCDVIYKSVESQSHFPDAPCYRDGIRS